MMSQVDEAEPEGNRLPPQLSEREVRRKARHQEMAGVIGKAAAILVALILSKVVELCIDSKNVVTLLAITLILYVAVCGLLLLISKLSVFLLDQYTHVAAELMAFMMRHCTKSLFAAILCWFDVPEERGYVAAALVIWAIVLIIFGLLFLSVRRRVHKDIFVNLADSFEDVDTDMIALPVGWTLHAALNTLVFGCEWEEGLEEAADRGNWYLLFAILSSGLAAWLTIWLEHLGAKENASIRLHMLLNSSGFMNGFMLSVYWSCTLDSNILGEHLGVGDVVCPLAMLLIGSKIIVCMRRREGRYLHSPSELRRNRTVIMILAYQVCMALAFERLFDKIIETLDLGILGDISLVGIFCVCWLVVVASVTARVKAVPEVDVAPEETRVELQPTAQ